MLLRRRAFLAGMASALFAPALVQASPLMPISSRNLPKLKYIVAQGMDAGAIEEFAGQPPSWVIPCDGRVVNGFDYPDLMRAVRGGFPAREEAHWIHIHHEDGHDLNTVTTVDRSVSMSWLYREQNLESPKWQN